MDQKPFQQEISRFSSENYSVSKRRNTEENVSSKINKNILKENTNNYQQSIPKTKRNQLNNQSLVQSQIYKKSQNYMDFKSHYDNTKIENNNFNYNSLITSNNNNNNNYQQNQFEKEKERFFKELKEKNAQIENLKIQNKENIEIIAVLQKQNKQILEIEDQRKKSIEQELFQFQQDQEQEIKKIIEEEIMKLTITVKDLQEKVNYFQKQNFQLSLSNQKINQKYESLQEMYQLLQIKNKFDNSQHSQQQQQLQQKFINLQNNHIDVKSRNNSCDNNCIINNSNISVKQQQNVMNAYFQNQNKVHYSRQHSISSQNFQTLQNQQHDSAEKKSNYNTNNKIKNSQNNSEIKNDYPNNPPSRHTSPFNHNKNNSSVVQNNNSQNIAQENSELQILQQKFDTLQNIISEMCKIFQIKDQNELIQCAIRTEKVIKTVPKMENMLFQVCQLVLKDNQDKIELLIPQINHWNSQMQQFDTIKEYYAEISRILQIDKNDNLIVKLDLIRSQLDDLKNFIQQSKKHLEISDEENDSKILNHILKLISEIKKLKK